MNVLDVSLMAQYWQANYDNMPLFDFNGNNVINLGDVLIVTAHIE